MHLKVLIEIVWRKQNGASAESGELEANILIKYSKPVRAPESRGNSWSLYATLHPYTQSDI